MAEITRIKLIEICEDRADYYIKVHAILCFHLTSSRITLTVKPEKKKKEKLVSLPLPAEDEPPCKKSSPNALPCLLYSSLPPPPSSLSLFADKSP
jgi:hypothetical protein